MTGVTTGQTSLPTATDSDDNEVFLTGPLTTALQTLVNLFDSITGHDHAGAGKGKPIGTAGISIGAFGAFTPTMTQGVAITLSVASGFYIQLGKLVFVTINVTANSAGTAANSIVIGNLPASSQQRASGAFVGTYSTGAAIYRLVSQWNGATAVLFWSADGGAATFGAGLTVAVGHVLQISGWYEAT